MAPQGDQVRVKRRGKSSPQDWRQDWHGKPHPGQGQIGGVMAWLASHPGRLLEPRSNARTRGMTAPQPQSCATEPGLSASFPLPFFRFAQYPPFHEARTLCRAPKRSRKQFFGLFVLTERTIRRISSKPQFWRVFSALFLRLTDFFFPSKVVRSGGKWVKVDKKGSSVGRRFVSLAKGSECSRALQR